MLNLDMDKLFFKVTSLSAVLSLLLNFLLIQFYGAWGASLSLLITEVVVTVVMGAVLFKQGIKILSFRNFNPLYAVTEFTPLLAGIKKRLLP
jgi:PST family polysaccharide transporter